MKTFLSFCFVLLFSLGLQAQSKINVKAQFALAEQQYRQMLIDHPDTSVTVHSANAKGYVNRPSSWWCSGFFGGSLWYLFEKTHQKEWKNAAVLWSLAVKKEQFNTHTHDLGFMLYCPFGNGLRLTKKKEYSTIMLRGAESLASRFDPNVGVIKSWEKFDKIYDYPVIIDNMMNLEFLFWASKVSGNKKYYNICISHADSTIKNHYRPDGSAFHVICYDKNGKVLAKRNHQGYADGSAWTRGQAWGVYGYTVMYRETKQKRYLDQAVKSAIFYLKNPNLPSDKIPYWDFSAPQIPNEERDASAGAVMASALLELSGYVQGEQRKTFFNNAEQMLVSLSSPAYRAKLGENNNFLIKHCVGAKSLNSEIDVPLVYADYYYLEGLLRYERMKK